MAVFNYLDPGIEGENIRYWVSQSNSDLSTDFYEVDRVVGKNGRSRTLRPVDEFLQ